MNAAAETVHFPLRATDAIEDFSLVTCDFNPIQRRQRRSDNIHASYDGRPSG